MTHYVMAVHSDYDKLGDISKEDMEAMFATVEAFNQKLRDSGLWVYANGLQPPSSATVVDGRGEKPVLTDGPYLEAKEHLGGFWIIDAPDLDVALDWAEKASKACGGPVEVRPCEIDSDGS